MNLENLIDVSTVTGTDVLIALAVALGGVILARVARHFVVRWLTSKSDIPEATAKTIGRLVSALIMLVAAVYAVSFIGVDAGPIFVIILVILAVAFFSLKPLLENLAAGLLIQARAPFTLGDEIESSPWKGTVTDIDSRTTVLVSPDGRHIRIPNTDVISNTLVNMTREGQLRSSARVGVAYGSNIATTRKLLTETTSSVAGVLTDPAPTAGVIEFDDSAIVFEVRFWHTPTAAASFRVTADVYEAIDSVLAANGIVIPFPQRDLWVRSPAAPATPETEETTE
ncbi:MAG: mechanosensitive ion channel [Acidimicrobiia bacterium]|nr:mechanosensitive ion channel [Acidimicrobiia bacterium]